MLTVERIFELAHDAALSNWYETKANLERLPSNPIAQHREAKAWAELEAVTLHLLRMQNTDGNA